MGEVYYKILEQNILSQSYYWHLLSEHWNGKYLHNIFYFKFLLYLIIIKILCLDLFALACHLYTVDFANMKHVSIKIMKHIIVRGDAHSSVALAVKKK